MNIRPPTPILPELLELQDHLLSAQREAKSVTGLEALPSILAEFPGTQMPLAEQLVLWRGDITTLAVDAIVNAANDRLLGCFILAAKYADIRSVVFCSISTGEFNFPRRVAAAIAVQTLCEWMERSNGRMDKIVFNVFTQEDHDIYARLFHTY
jgi:hypothetical protein